MFSVQSLKLVTQVSSVLGIVGLIVYLYFQLLYLNARRRVGSSVHQALGGGTIFTQRGVLKILRQVKDPARQLDALAIILNHDRDKANDVLKKVKSNVSIVDYSEIASKRAQRMALIPGVLSLALASVAYAAERSKKVELPPTLPQAITPSPVPTPEPPKHSLPPRAPTEADKLLADAHRLDGGGENDDAYAKCQGAIKLDERYSSDETCKRIEKKYRIIHSH